MKRPIESDYTSHVAYTRALEEYCDAFVQQKEKDEPVKIIHEHKWFNTGEMKVGQMRCISCGTWGQEEIPQRTWVKLTDDDRVLIKHDANFNQFMTAGEYADRVQQLTEARLKDKNT